MQPDGPVPTVRSTAHTERPTTRARTLRARRSSIESSRSSSQLGTPDGEKRGGGHLDDTPPQMLAAPVPCVPGLGGAATCGTDRTARHEPVTDASPVRRHLHRKGCRRDIDEGVTLHPRPTCGTRAARTSSSRGLSATCAAGGSAAWCATCRGRGSLPTGRVPVEGRAYRLPAHSLPRGPAEASRSSTSRASHRSSPPRSGCTESPWSRTTCWRRRTGWNRAAGCRELTGDDAARLVRRGGEASSLERRDPTRHAGTTGTTAHRRRAGRRAARYGCVKCVGVKAASRC